MGADEEAAGACAAPYMCGIIVEQVSRSFGSKDADRVGEDTLVFSEPLAVGNMRVSFTPPELLASPKSIPFDAMALGPEPGMVRR